MLAGLSPLDALRTATSTPARVLRDPDIGAIPPGKRADIVLVDGNPVEDIGALRRLRGVVARGRLYKPNDLRALSADEHPTGDEPALTVHS